MQKCKLCRGKGLVPRYSNDPKAARTAPCPQCKGRGKQGKGERWEMPR